MSRTVDRLFINKTAAELGLNIDDKLSDEVMLKAIASISKPAHKVLMDRINMQPHERKKLHVRVALTCHNPDRLERGTEELFFSIDGKTVGQIMFYRQMQNSWIFKEPVLNLLLGRKFHATQETPFTGLDGRPVADALNAPRVLGMQYEFSARLLPQMSQAELDNIAKRQAVIDGVEQQTMNF